jgi:sugar phosphate isomerase/epimerase
MKPPFPIYCCSIARRDRPIFEAVREIAGAGFSGVEIWYPHIEKMRPAELQALLETCRGLALTPAVISPYFTFTRGGESRKQSLKTAEAVLQAAQILGVKKVRTFIDCGPEGVRSEAATEEHWTSAREGLRQLCDLDAGTQFVVETHEFTLANTLPTAQRIIDEVARTNLRLNYQPTRDFMRRGYLECLEALYPSVAHMHWEQVGADGKGTYLEEKGAIDFPALIRFQRERKYEGTASVEYCWMPVEPSRVESAGKYLDGLLGESEQTSSRAA